MAIRLVEARVDETGSDDRAAWFVCALAVAWPKGPVVAVEGQIDGALAFPPRGMRGFGYDPIFIPEGGAETFGEMDPAEKHAISHRGARLRGSESGPVLTPAPRDLAVYIHWPYCAAHLPLLRFQRRA